MNKGPFVYQRIMIELEQTLTTTTAAFIPKNLLSNYQPHNAILPTKLETTIDSIPTQSNSFSPCKSFQHMFGYNDKATPEIFKNKKVKRKKHRKKRKKKHSKSTELPLLLI